MSDDYKEQKNNLLFILKAALNGLLHTLSVQRNMKIHWISGYMVMLIGMSLDFNLTLRSALFFSVFLILFAEILNSALEAFVDLHIQDYDYHAKLAKDAAAAGVLILSFGVAVLFFDILYTQRQMIRQSLPQILTTLQYGLPSILLMGFLLFRYTQHWLKVLILLCGLITLIPLIYHSTDHFFSFVSVLFIFWHIVPK